MIHYFDPKKQIPMEETIRLVKDRSFVDACEAEFEQRVETVAKEVVENGCSLVLLAGPSASGKTTSARKVALALKALGHPAQVLSLDNFFKDMVNYPIGEDGLPDFEHIDTLDIEEINHCLKDLTEKGEAGIPMFDFRTKTSHKDAVRLRIKPGEVVVVEGIHALNPVCSSAVNEKHMYKMYVGLRSEYYDGDKRVIATRDLRITRRIVRDARDRGHGPEETLSMWRKIMDGEERWIKPFKKDARVLLNTAMDYEPALFASTLRKLDEEQAGGAYQEDLHRLAEAFAPMGEIPFEWIPEKSLLREFIGGLVLEQEDMVEIG